VTISDRGVLFISGVPGAGKTTVSSLVAPRLSRSALIHGDDVHDMVVSGRRYPSEGEAYPEEVELQMQLRDRNIVALTNNFTHQGFLTVIDDCIVGLPRWKRLLAGIRARPVYLAMLAPDVGTVEQRDRDRDKHVFHLWSHLDAIMRRDMSGIGYWIDTTAMTAEATADAVLARVWVEGRIDG
jgi:hypothetical protein